MDCFVGHEMFMKGVTEKSMNNNYYYYYYVTMCNNAKIMLSRENSLTGLRMYAYRSVPAKPKKSSQG